MVSGNLAYKLQKEPKKEKDYTFLPEKPKWTTVSLLDIVNNNYRFEAGAFNLEAKAAINKIKQNKWGFVYLWSNNGLIKNAFYPGRFKRIYVEKGQGYPFFLPSQLTEIYPKPTKFISEKTYKQIKGIEIEQNNLLLTRSGTIGKCTISSKTTIGKVFSDDVIRVSFKNTFDLGFAYAFIQTGTGQKILTTNNYGAVVKHIEPEHLKNVIIPNPPDEIKKRVHELVVKSYDLRDQSNELIDKAEKILYEELQLPPIEDLKPEYFDNSKDLRNWQTKLSELDYRLEANYHHPLVYKIKEILKTNTKEIKQIGDKNISDKIYIGGRFKRVYMPKGEGAIFISGKNILELDPSNKKYISASIHQDRILKELTLKKDTIIITCSGTIGKTVIVPEHWDGWVATHDLIRLKAKKNITGYLYSWLNTEYGQFLLKHMAYGSVVEHIEVMHLEKIPVPIIKNEARQKEINDLVLKANELRYEAYLKEQEAIRIVNEEVINETVDDLNMVAENKVEYKKSNKS